MEEEDQAHTLNFAKVWIQSSWALVTLTLIRQRDFPKPEAKERQNLIRISGNYLNVKIWILLLLPLLHTGMLTYRFHVLSPVWMFFAKNQ